MSEPAPPSVSPLEVLLCLMRRKWAAGDWEGAANIAKIAAPYLHPRAAPAVPDKTPIQMDDDELAEWMERDDDAAEVGT